MKKLILLLCLLCAQFHVFSQAELYIGGELVGGTMGGSAFNSDLLKQRNYSPTLGGQINASVRLWDVFALEVGIGQHWSRVRLIDNDFEDQADDFSIKIKNSSFHWSYHAAAAAYYPIKKTDSYIYGKFGLAINTYNESSISESSTFQISSLNIDRELEYTTSYKRNNYSLIPEIGVQHKFYKGNLLSVGLRYNIGQSTAFESEYTVTDQVSGQSSTDGLSSKGSSFAFTIRYDFRLLHFNKKEKVKKLDLDRMAIDVSKKQEEEKKEPQIAGPSNRKIVVTDHLKVRSKKVKIEIWDHQTVDGDRVTVVFNNQVILENYTLKKEKLELEVELEEGVNTFVMHALNLGEIKPNTAALMVDDGEKKKRIILQSNMSKSGTLEIKYKP